MPTAVATMAKRATGALSSPWLQHAPMAMITVPAEATRKGTECSGGPGRLAWTTRCHRVTVDPPTEGRPRRGGAGPASREARPGPGADRGRSGRGPGAGTGPRPRGCRAPPADAGARQPVTTAMTRSASASAAAGSGGSTTSMTTGSSVWRSRSRTMSTPDVGGGRPVDRPAGVPGLDTAGRPGARRRRRGPASGDSPAASSTPCIHGARACPSRGATWSGRGRGTSTSRAHHSRPKGRRKPPRPRPTPARPRRSGVTSPPPDGDPGTDPRPGPTGPSGSGAGCGWARWPSA